MKIARSNPAGTNRLLMSVAGLGGLLYGIDIGIIAAALLYISKTIHLTLAQTSLIVAAVLGGSMVSSLGAGLLADWLGRKKAMVLSGCLFVASVVMIVLAHSFATLLIGRLLQGASGGVIAVVIPLYLAECLSPETRGRGAAIFQLMVTFGVVVASVAGWCFTIQAEAAVAAAHGNLTIIRAAQDHAWRGMFLSVIVPGLFFLMGTTLLIESPRWLFRKGRTKEALATLRALAKPELAEIQFREMEALLSSSQSAGGETQRKNLGESKGPLLQRKYVIPFLLACVVLACNQATGINSVLGFLVVLLRQAGMSARMATQGDVAVKLLHCLITLVAVALIERKGRVFLLRIGTGGVLCSLILCGLLFYSFESRGNNVRAQLEPFRRGNTLLLPTASRVEQLAGIRKSSQPTALTVLYSYGDGDHIATVSSLDSQGVEIAPEGTHSTAPLTIKKASYGPTASPAAGWLIAICLASFVCFFSLGPGVVVWLALSELMPTRIRSTGMGVALVINQGVSTLLAALFLPVVGNFGYHTIFFFWAACTAIYFAVAAFFLPETKGKTLEEIEESFVSKGRRAKRSLSLESSKN